MSIGQLTSGNLVSSISYTGAPITVKLSTTSEDQELILFAPDDYDPNDESKNKLKKCNTITIGAGSTDLYVALLTRNRNAETFDFTDAPVIFIEADTVVNISGVAVSGIKFSGASGTEYFYNGMSY